MLQGRGQYREPFFCHLFTVEPFRSNVATAASSLDIDTSKLPGRRIRTWTDENVVVLCRRQNAAVDVVHEDVGNVNTFRRYTGRSSVHYKTRYNSAIML